MRSSSNTRDPVGGLPGRARRVEQHEDPEVARRAAPRFIHARITGASGGPFDDEIEQRGQIQPVAIGLASVALLREPEPGQAAAQPRIV